MPLTPHDNFNLEKTVWTEADFDQMEWHDVHIHAMAFSKESNELFMDIDYMFAWVDPEYPAQHYTFWIAPCTWVFSNVHSFTAEIEWGLGLEIMDVIREDTRRPQNADYIQREKEWKWLFDCQEGTFSFRATGYKQITPCAPIRAQLQALPWIERGGISFDQSPYTP